MLCVGHVIGKENVLCVAADTDSASITVSSEILPVPVGARDKSTSTLNLTCETNFLRRSVKRLVYASTSSGHAHHQKSRGLFPLGRAIRHPPLRVPRTATPAQRHEETA